MTFQYMKHVQPNSTASERFAHARFALRASSGPTRTRRDVRGTLVVVFGMPCKRAMTTTHRRISDYNACFCSSLFTPSLATNCQMNASDAFITAALIRKLRHSHAQQVCVCTVTWPLLGDVEVNREEGGCNGQGPPSSTCSTTGTGR